VTQAKWASSWTLVMVAAGSVVGLGNIWWLPVLAGEHGGLAFWLVYMFCLVVLGTPLLVAEFAVGAAGESDPVTSLEHVARRSGHSPHIALAGAFSSGCGLLIAPLCVVVAGWSLAFGILAWMGEFQNIDANAAAAVLDRVMSTPGEAMAWSGSVMCVAVLISLLGVVHGLGLAARILMPAALALFVGVAYYSRHYGDLDATFDYLFHLDWSELDLEAIGFALSFAALSLGVGTGVMVVLGSHLPYKDDIPVAALSIVLLEMFVALLAGYVLLPMVFASDMVPAGGVALVFVGVPVAFGGLVNGQVFTVALYLAVLAAALTSIVALMEPAVAALTGRRGMPRYGAVLLVGLVVWLLVAAGIHSLAGWHDGKWLYDQDYLVRMVLPLSALLVAGFVGWLAAPMMAAEDFAQSPLWAHGLWRFILRWLAVPALVLAWAISLFGAA